jgi:hypothetical protein
MMAVIYRRASGVIIWLGPEVVQTESVVWLFQRLLIGNGYRSRVIPMTNSMLQADQALRHEMATLASMMKDGVHTFFNNLYWTRLWIVQKVVLCHYQPSIHWGPNKIPWRALEAFWSRVHLNDPDLIPVSTHQKLQYMMRCVKLRSGTKHSFFSILSVFRTSKCHDPRDRVYGLLAMVEPMARPQVDYSRPTLAVFLGALRRMV